MSNGDEKRSWEGLLLAVAAAKRKNRDWSANNTAPFKMTKLTPDSEIMEEEKAETGFSIHHCKNFTVTANNLIDTKRIRQLTGDCKETTIAIPQIIEKFTCLFLDHPLTFRLTDRAPICGNNGAVLFYEARPSSSTIRHKLCVKHTIDDGEAKMVQKLDSTDIKCGQVPAKIILKENRDDHYSINSRGNKVYAFAMPVYTGTLTDFTKKNKRLSQTTICRIIRNISNQLTCLYDKGKLCYMDIKPDNILYDLAEGNETDSIVVTVADLGSDGISSKYCPLASRRDPRRPGCSNTQEFACMKFNLIVLLAELLLSDEDLYQQEWLLYANYNDYYLKRYHRRYWDIRDSGLESKSLEHKIRNDRLKEATAFAKKFPSLEDVLLPLPDYTPVLFPPVYRRSFKYGRRR